MSIHVLKLESFISSSNNSNNDFEHINISFWNIPVLVNS